jgi:hypothetical protein
MCNSDNMGDGGSCIDKALTRAMLFVTTNEEMDSVARVQGNAANNVKAEASIF